MCKPEVGREREDERERELSLQSIENHASGALTVPSWEWRPTWRLSEELELALLCAERRAAGERLHC